MSPIIRRGSVAREDLLENFLYIGHTNRTAARRFLRAAEKAMGQLAEMPGLGSVWETANPVLEGTRVWQIPKFKNYLIFYRPISNGIEVVRVLHGARDIEHLAES